MKSEHQIAPTYIDGQPWLFRLPTGGAKKDSPSEWDAIMDKLGDNNDLLHWKDMFSMCQDTVYPNSMYRTRRGYVSSRFWLFNRATYRDASLGYRPVLVPLNPDTMEPDTSRLSALPDGTTKMLGTLTMGGRAVMISQDPTDGSVVPYYTGEDLKFCDTSSHPEYQIQWVKCGDILIADHNLLCGISWNDLDKQGLVFGNLE